MMKTNEDYIFEAVDLAWRWYRTQNKLRNSLDSGIRCMDINDPWIISTDDIRHGSGPGVDLLLGQLKHQATNELSEYSSIDLLKKLVDSGEVVPKR